jgi:hypothetical protein
MGAVPGEEPSLERADGLARRPAHGAQSSTRPRGVAAAQESDAA